MIARPSRFPNPRETTPEGIVAVGGDLMVETLIDAYSHGIFPWPQDGLPMLWFSPPERGIIDLTQELHAPERFLRDFGKWVANPEFEIRVDTAFERVIDECRLSYRPNQNGTWILREMQEAYQGMHSIGLAHSVEVFWSGELVGGLYGVFLRGVFSGESMFHRKKNFGKAALWATMNLLKKNGIAMIDVQMVTPVVQTFGGQLIARDEYLSRLLAAQNDWERQKCRFEWVKGRLSL